MTGFRPVLLPTQDLDGRSRLVPHNLISAWYWVEGGADTAARAAGGPQGGAAPGRKVPSRRGAALGIAHGVAAGRRMLDTPEKVEAVRRRLEAVGVVRAAYRGGDPAVQPASRRRPGEVGHAEVRDLPRGRLAA